MNQFKNGTLLIVIATIVSSILILMTDHDDSSVSKQQPDVALVENQTDVADAVLVENEPAVADAVLVENNPDAALVENKPEPDATLSETESAVEKSEVETVIINDETEVIEDKDINLVQKAMSSVTEAVEIKAPTGPFNKATSGDPSNTNNVNSDQDESSQAVQLGSSNVEATSTQHDLLNHIIQPIWMDQKLGDFKSLETSDVVFKIMPTSPNGLQGENPQQVVTSKDDKLSPTAVSKDYNYQQMPMYNGGYYIAPMPSYLMRSVLPTSATDKGQ